jgi:hypothetical protein
VTAEVAAAVGQAASVASSHDGPAEVVGATVMHDEDRAHAVALLDLPTGDRLMAGSEDAATIELLQTEECCGRRAVVMGRRFTL